MWILPIAPADVMRDVRGLARAFDERPQAGLAGLAQPVEIAR
jgi:hypothetical protein